jgi:hypothetical protein
LEQNNNNFAKDRKKRRSKYSADNFEHRRCLNFNELRFTEPILEVRPSLNWKGDSVDLNAIALVSNLINRL